MFIIIHHKLHQQQFKELKLLSALNEYANNVEINKFGGRFKYSKINTLIDRVDNGITSNITKGDY